MIDESVRSTPSIVPISSMSRLSSAIEGAAMMAIRSKEPLTEWSSVTAWTRSRAAVTCGSALGAIVMRICARMRLAAYFSDNLTP